MTAGASDLALPGGSADAPLLEVAGLVRHYPLPRTSLFAPAPVVRALDGVSFRVEAGRSLGIVGESGSGKSTLARLVMALDKPTAGHVRLQGRDLNALDARELRDARRDFQMVFQDLSGGQRQRIAIARALITRPKLIVADEPVSALDVSVQAQVLNLMQDLQQREGISFLLISHDLAVVNHLCDDVVVLLEGKIVEAGPPERLFRDARHPYTRRLLAAVPRGPALVLAQSS